MSNFKDSGKLSNPMGFATHLAQLRYQVTQAESAVALGPQHGLGAFRCRIEEDSQLALSENVRVDSLRFEFLIFLLHCMARQ